MVVREFDSSPRARMPGIRHSGLLLMFLVFGLSACATTRMDGARSAQCPPSIAAPSLEAGDLWAWKDASGRPWHRQYLRKTDDGLVEVERKPDGVRFQYDNTHTLRKVYSEGAWLTSPTPKYPTIGETVLAFPLNVGKTWNYRMLAPESRGAGILTYESTFTVERCGTVKVPAGEFFAVAIEESQRIVGMRSWGNRTWWYAPDVNYFIKLSHGLASHSSYWSSHDWELVSYKIAASSRSTATAAVPPTPGAVPQPAVPASPGTPQGTPPATPAPATVGQPAPAAIAASALPPVWQKGYEWHYSWTGPRGSGSFTRVIQDGETVEGHPCYAMRSGTRVIYYTKADLAWLTDKVEGAIESKANPPESRFAWPLAVGKEWETSSRIDRPLARSTEDRWRRAKVEGWVTVTVPAGTFWAYHIVVRDRTGAVTSEQWYAPDVKWMVQERFHSTNGIEERKLGRYSLSPTK